MSLADMTAAVEPGSGLVARFPHVALVVLAPAPEHGDFLERLLATVEREAAASTRAGRHVVRQVASLFTGVDPDAAPALALLADTDDGYALLLWGAIDAAVARGEATERLSARDAVTWVDRIIHEPADGIVLGRRGRAPGHLRTHFDLRAGVVPGAGLALAPRGRVLTPAEGDDETVVDAVPAAVDVPDAPDATAERAPFSSVLLDQAEPEDEARTPLPVAGGREPEPELLSPPQPRPAEPPDPAVPVVKGIRCSRGHFNDPLASFCSACGISMVQQTHNLVDGHRPPLGILVLDDGMTLSLDADYVVGREPDRDPSVRAGRARAVSLTDPDHALSRVHASIALEGWQVKVSDRGSANGTYVARPGEPGWTRLAPDEPVSLVSGTYVLVGRRTMVFDSHHKR